MIIAGTKPPQRAFGAAFLGHMDALSEQVGEAWLVSHVHPEGVRDTRSFRLINVNPRR